MTTSKTDGDNIFVNNKVDTPDLICDLVLEASGRISYFAWPNGKRDKTRVLFGRIWG